MKDKKMFDEWLSVFRSHRLYRQHEIAYGTKESPKLTGITSPVEDLTRPFSPGKIKPTSVIFIHSTYIHICLERWKIYVIFK